MEIRSSAEERECTYEDERVVQQQEVSSYETPKNLLVIRFKVHTAAILYSTILELEMLDASQNSLKSHTVLVSSLLELLIVQISF